MTGGAAIVLLATALPARADQVDDYVRAQMERQRIPGLALAVIRDGKVVKATGYGFANLEHRVPVTPETVFQSGSVGKQFAAAATLLLVEEGRLSLDDRLGKHIAGAPAHWGAITIRHLLTHTSGITEYTDAIDLRRDYSEDDLVKMAAEKPLDFEPGTAWKYSNTGYALLGVAIGKAAGRFYGDYLQERVFRPLAMNTTRIISEADIVPNRAAGYRLVRGELKNQEWVSPALNTTADGALYLTVIDLAKWDAALYTDVPLKQRLKDQMWAPARLLGGEVADARGSAYGFGWSLGDQRGHRLIDHAGAWQGFQAYIGRFVDDRLSVAALSNLGGSDPGAIARGVAGLYESALLTADHLTPRPDPDPARGSRLLGLLGAFAEGKDGKLAEQAFFSSATAEQRATTADHLKGATALDFLACDEVRGGEVTRHGIRVGLVCQYRLTAPAGPRDYTFWLTPAGRLAGFVSRRH